jgi:hypothetical protein
LGSIRSQKFTLHTVQVLRSDSKELANDARKEMDALLRKLHGRVPKAERFALRGELASLRKEVRQRCESRIVTLGVSGGESALAAVSRRPPISLDTIVARTEGYA